MSGSLGKTPMGEIVSADEVMIGRMPVTVRRRVKWGECDPAGVVYMANYGEYVISAYEMCMAVLLDEPFQKAKSRLGVALPAKAFGIEFAASLRPDDEFAMTVEIAEIRTRTFDVRVWGRTIDLRDLFSA